MRIPNLIAKTDKVNNKTLESIALNWKMKAGRKVQRIMDNIREDKKNWSLIFEIDEVV